MSDTLLSREQVEALRPLAKLEALMVYLDEQRSSLGLHNALAVMIDQDALLRVELAALTMHHDATRIELGLSGLEGRSHASFIQQLKVENEHLRQIVQNLQNALVSIEKDAKQMREASDE